MPTVRVVDVVVLTADGAGLVCGRLPAKRITVMNQPRALLDATPPQGHLQGVQREIGAHVGGELPSDDHARVHA